MPSPDRSPRFIRFLFVVYMIGVLTPAVASTACVLAIDGWDLDGPWPTVVYLVSYLTVGVLAAVAIVRLDDLRRRRM